MRVSSELIEKYSVSGPRYTSYPTAVEFHEGVGVEEWQNALRADERERLALGDNEQTNFSLYVHIPFCATLCYYCACNKVITDDRALMRSYLNAVYRELDAYQELLGSDIPIEQIHWGGGTPNSLLPEEMAELHQRCVQTFPNITADAEISVEIDPRTTSDEHLRALKQAGFNRVSMGVQDFDAHVQHLVNRVQPYEMTKHVCDYARTLGFEGLNIDLIYGLPDQTVDGLAASVDKVLNIRPDRVALYGYAHVKWIQKVQKALERAHLPTPHERVEIFLRAMEKFTDAGYRYIGMDHFALPDDELSKALDRGTLNRTFMGYTTHRGARIIGLGASSISMLPGAFAQNQKEVSSYLSAVDEHGFATFRGVLRSQEDRRRGELIHDLLCEGRVDVRAHELKWGLSFAETYAEALDALRSFEADQLLTLSPEAITLSQTGRFFMRNIAMNFDAYLPLHRAGNKPVFSQAV